MGRGDASGARTPVGRRYHRLLSDVDGAKSMKLRLAVRWPAAVAHKGGAVLGLAALEGRRTAERWIPGSPALRWALLE